MATNRNAILFNPANPNLLAYGLDGSRYTGTMRQYVVATEILSVLKPQGISLGPVAQSRVPSVQTIPLPAQYKMLTIIDSILNHLMGAVKSAL